MARGIPSQGRGLPVSGRALSHPTGPVSGVFRYTFDNEDTEGTTTLDEWNNNDGTINGATTGVSGANQTYQTGEAYSFDGTDDTVSVGDVYNGGSKPFSVAGWFLIDSYDSNRCIISNENTSTNAQHILRAESDGNIYFYHNNSGSWDTLSKAGPASGTWAFVFAFHDPGNETIGLNIDSGTRTTMNTTGLRNATVDKWTIGLDPSGNQYWGGDLDDKRLYGKVLSTTEEQNLYDTGSISG